MFFHAFGALVSDHKIDYSLVGLDDTPDWIPPSWRFIHLGVIVRYLGIPFGVGLSPMAMWNWYEDLL